MAEVSASAPLVEAIEPERYPAGGAYRLRLHAADLPDGAAVAVPCWLLVGGRPGPRLVAVAGVHGDEYEGPRALMALAREIDPAELAGTVSLVPFANPLAYNAGQRRVPAEALDLNRHFPGRPDGSLGQRLAHALVHRLIAPCDLAIDLHSAGQTGLMLPLSGYREQTGEVARRSALAAAAFGLEVPWLMRWQPGTLSTALNELGIAAVGCEVGGLGLAREADVTLYQDGVRRCLRQLGCLGPPLAVELPAEVWPFDPVTSPWSGLLDPAVALGDPVEAGAAIARVLDPWGDPLGTITAPRTGRILHQRLFRQAQAGDTVVSLGWPIPHPLRS